MAEFKLGELFCGPGGLAWGAINAVVPGMRIVHAWANDYDVILKNWETLMP